MSWIVVFTLPLVFGLIAAASHMFVLYYSAARVSRRGIALGFVSVWACFITYIIGLFQI